MTAWQRAVDRRRAPDARGAVAKWILVVYALVVVEGAIRKWLLPELSSLLFFLKDAALLWAYAIALRAGLWPARSLVFVAVATLAGAFLILAAIQALTTEIGPVTLLYGWRNYFLYAFLIVLVPAVFSRAQLVGITRLTLLAAIPMTVLAQVQFAAPPDAFINKQLEASGPVFTVVQGIVRVTGTFSFTAGYATFVASAWALCLGAWFGMRRDLGLPLLAAASAACLGLVAVSGSRTAFLGIAVVLVASAGAQLVSRRINLVRLAAAVVVPVAAWLLFVNVFPRAYAAMAERQTTAVSQEGETLARAVRAYTMFLPAAIEAPWLGAGIGAGSGGGSTLETGRAQFTLGEDEWSRVLMESGPIFGLVYIFFRIALAGAIVAGAIRAHRATGDSTGLLLAAFTLPILLTGPITFQGTYNAYAWLFAGLCLAANRQARAAISSPPRLSSGA